MRNIIIIFIFLLFISLLKCIDGNASKTRFLGSTSEGKSLNKNHVDLTFNPEHLDLKTVKATTTHEMFHSLRNLDFITYDIPLASAIGFYTEYVDNNELSDKRLNKEFKKADNVHIDKIHILINLSLIHISEPTRPY